MRCLPLLFLSGTVIPPPLFLKQFVNKEMMGGGVIHRTHAGGPKPEGGINTCSTQTLHGYPVHNMIYLNQGRGGRGAFRARQCTLREIT